MPGAQNIELPIPWKILRAANMAGEFVTDIPMVENAIRASAIQR
jgi:hypothetical protein